MFFVGKVGKWLRAISRLPLRTNASGPYYPAASFAQLRTVEFVNAVNGGKGILGESNVYWIEADQ